MNLPPRAYFLASALLLGACSSNYDPGDFTREYRQALEQYPGAEVSKKRVERFTETYGDFTGDQLGERLNELYAREFYFNDTLHTHRTRPELVAYLEQTRDRLEAMSLEVLDTQVQGRDLYLRWAMHTEFEPLFSTVAADTVGMSHLRFNQAGKVVLHQDFWDSRQGVFEHLPIVGGLIRWIRSGL